MSDMTSPRPAAARKTAGTAPLPLAAMMLAGFSLNVAAQTATATSPTAPAEPAVLPEVRVRADGEAPPGYRAETTRVGKTLQDPHDIPQAVTSVTRTLMDEQQVGSLREALRNVSGLTFNAAEGGRAGDNMNLRGFYTFGDIYLDGIRDTAQYNRETFNLEQVDVLRGAGAMLFGRGQAGGVINQVSKTAGRQAGHTVGASIGTDGYRELTADLNEPFSDATALRVNLMRRDEGSWRSNPATGTEPDLHRQGAAISLGLNLDTQNRFWFNYIETDTDDNPDYGIPFDADTRAPTKAFAPDTFWGTGRNFDESRTRVATVVNDLVLRNGGVLRTQLRSGDYERSYWARTPSGTQAPNAGGVVIGGNGNANGGPTRVMDYETLTLQSDYSRAFNFAGMYHTVLIGGEVLKENSFRHSLQNLGGSTADNPPAYQPYVANTGGTPVRFKGDSLALYAQDTVEFVPQWQLTLGARRDELDAEYASATSPKLSYGEWSTRVALSHHPAEDTHYYVAVSDSFSPTADLYQLTVTPQPPERSNVAELGAKWLLADGDLALRAALYRATKHWERNADLESTAAILTKKRRTDGIELEAAGRINEHWEVFAGVALMDATILEVAENINANTGTITLANAGFAGQRARNTPRYTGTLWTTWRWHSGWKIGGGFEAKGDRLAYVPSSSGALPTLPGETAFHPNTAPAYVRWDAMLAYEQPRWAVRLNVRNVFDTVYYDAVYDNGAFAIPGPARGAILSAELKF